jgi:hypothetical protein
MSFILRSGKMLGEDPHARTYELAIKGGALAMANAKPITRSTAERLVADFRQRVEEVNGDPNLLHRETKRLILRTAVSIDLRSYNFSAPAQQKLGMEQGMRSSELTSFTIFCTSVEDDGKPNKVVANYRANIGGASSWWGAGGRLLARNTAKGLMADLGVLLEPKGSETGIESLTTQEKPVLTRYLGIQTSFLKVVIVL